MARITTAEPSAAPEKPAGDPGAFEERLTSYAKVGIPVGTVVLAGAAGVALGPSSSILVLAGGALVGVIATFWASVRTLIGETPLGGADAYALGAPRAEEEQKRAVLRALKDLEFERSVGKISEDDYRDLVARYREEAKRLLRLLDADAAPARSEVERLVERRLRRAGLLAGDASADAPGTDAHADPDSNDGAVAETDRPEVVARAEADAPRERKRSKSKRKQRALPAEVPPAPAAAVDAPATENEPTAEPPPNESSLAPGRADPNPVEPARASAAAVSPSIPPPVASGSIRPAPLRMKKRPSSGEAACAACGAANDADAVFCKKCGKRFGEASVADKAVDTSLEEDA